MTELARRSGTSVDRLRVDPAAAALESDRQGALRLSRYLMAEPSRAPATIEAMNRSLMESVGAAPRLQVLAHLSWDRPPVSRPLEIETVRLPGDTASNPVEAAMKRLYAGTGKRFQGKERTRVIDDTRRFPPVLSTEVARLIDAVARAHRMREAVAKSSSLKQGGAFDTKSNKTANLLRDFLTRWWEPGLATDDKLSRVCFAVETVDLNGIYAGALPLADALDNAADALSGLPAMGSFHAHWETPLGRIAVGGSGNDEYEGAYALIVDVGGKDAYHGPGAASGKDPVAMVLDLGGDDRYSQRDSAQAGPGGAVLGYAGILDAAGTDTYTGTSWAAGFGFLGVGWIDDRGGDDTYTMQFMSQGCSLFGIGLLLDASGNDQYTLKTMDNAFPDGLAQGFGGPLGAGSLIDLGGNDRFVDSNTHAERRDEITGLVQGAAWGGGNAWAGGFGWLLDGSGNDFYEGVMHAQGAALGPGLGVLADVSGDDTYAAEARAQGFGERLGVGILYEGSGKDRYRARAAAMGSGHDLGLGMLLEAGGDDAYVLEGNAVAGELPSVAGASLQGAGWLLELEGNDSYPDVRGQVFSGSGVPWRSPVPGVSVLIDVGQPDTQETYTPCSGQGPALGGTLILPTPNAVNNGGSP
ncbi:MAG TPA: hypothetical protein VFP10_08130 [Candidatus Eisenbacteria bacterium]|nr:hypothetical protein [Candidatus Eisenbacteria bacterium]